MNAFESSALKQIPPAELDMFEEPVRLVVFEDSAEDEEFLRDLLLDEEYLVPEFHTLLADEENGRLSDAEIAADVFLLDISTTFESGPDPLYELHTRHPHIPIIVITEEDDSDALQTVFQSGAQDYLVKRDLDRHSLLRAIRYVLERNRLISQLYESKRLERYLAYHDSLTNLPNRHLLYDRLQQAVAHAKRSGQQVALLFLDLDGFKRINDTLGHGTGDQLLKAVASRLRTSVREVDTIARLGGDEFTIVLVDLHDVQDAARVARKILAVMAAPYNVNEHEVFVTASIVISIYPNDGSDIEGLIRKADIAMYRAKGHGKNTFQIYNLSMDAKFYEHLTLENSLRRAIENNELTVYYQPQVMTTTGEIIGLEALVRWQHPEFGLVPPDEFIPLAEETGMIVEIDGWVLGNACRQLRLWHEMGHQNLRISVNLSARQFRENGLPELVRDMLTESGLQAEYLCLEITESNVMQNVDNTIRILHQLKAMGVQLSIDDFGTGYSSLNYLKRFPIDILKIDRSFVKGIPIDRDDTAISTAIVVLAKSMQLRVVAEGVENEEQAGFLHSLDCHEMQGFLFSKPVRPESISNLLQSGKVLYFASIDLPC
jgi:diguanylate cyclase (GGDEF)-like protein